MTVILIWVVFLYGRPTNCCLVYTVIRRKIVFICSDSYAVYTVITHKIALSICVS